MNEEETKLLVRIDERVANMNNDIVEIKKEMEGFKDLRTILATHQTRIDTHDKEIEKSKTENGLVKIFGIAAIIIGSILGIKF